MTHHDDEWKVLPHDPIQRLAENLWRVEGDLPHFGLRRVMTIARMTDGRLVIHSAIALDEPQMAELEAWGRPAFLLVPHSRHRLDAPRYKRRYPSIRVLATPGAAAKAREVVPIDGTYDDFPADGTVLLRMLRGTRQSEGAMIVRSSDGFTVVLNEVVFHLGHPEKFVPRLLARAFGHEPKVTTVVKMELVDDRTALRDELLDLAAIPGLTRLVVSHQELSSGAAASRDLRVAAASL